MAEITVNELVNWLAEQKWSEFAQSLANYHDAKGYLTEKQEAAARSMHAKCTAKAAAKAAPKGEALEIDGVFYKAETDTVYKVQWNREHTSLYAKQLVEHDNGTFNWDYVGKGPLYKLTEDDKLTAEKAAAFGKMYGVCVFCGLTLTNEASIEVGYGPVCAENNGLPWGHVTPVMAAANTVANDDGEMQLILD